jgi:hypothetical protein
MHDDPRQNPCGGRFDLHGRLFRLDFGDGLAFCHRIAFVFQPTRKQPLGHVEAQGGHDDVGGHESLPDRSVRGICYAMRKL